MKKLIIVFIVFLTYSVSSAQQCSKFYPLQEGVNMELTTYNKKGETAAIVSTTVTSVRSEEGKQIATLESEIKDVNGEEISQTSYDVICEGETISLDFKSMIDANMLKQYKDMDYEVSGSNTDLPNNIAVGDELPDSNLEMKIDMGGLPMKLTIDITDRKVVATESISTSAGTFDCFVIEYTHATKMGMKRTTTGKQWISEGVGVVKQEDYNKKGKVTSSTELTAFSK